MFFFIICCTILTNLFIAMIGNTISSIQETSKQQYKFNFAWTAAFYGCKEAIPPPFNLLHLGATLTVWAVVTAAEALCIVFSWFGKLLARRSARTAPADAAPQGAAAEAAARAPRLQLLADALGGRRRSLWGQLRKDPRSDVDPANPAPLFAWYKKTERVVLGEDDQYHEVPWEEYKREMVQRRDNTNVRMYQLLFKQQGKLTGDEN